MIPSLKPFHNIAVCMSGGGFRAAAFSLGTLDYLNSLTFDQDKNETLLQRVSFISSTSGGTITAACYAQAQRKHDDFPVFYQHVLKNLTGDGLLLKALQKLCDDDTWKASPDKSRNLINAFSLVYDDELFGHATFASLREVKDGLCGFSFNATEFYSGISFRFQHDNYTGDNRGVVGNARIFFDKDKDDYKHLKLADMLAASSCFPGGFEPILFPQDFRYPSLPAGALDHALFVKTYSQEISPLAKGQNIALMDGGIDDNQGLQSVMLADNRRTDQQKFDLILSSDVTSYSMDPYEDIKDKPPAGWLAENLRHYIDLFQRVYRSVSMLVPIGIIVFIALLAGCFFTNTPWNLLCSFFAGGILIATCVLIAIKKKAGYYYVQSRVGEEPKKFIREALVKIGASKNFSDKTIDELGLFLLRTPVGDIWSMIKERAASILVLSMDVNLKQTRRLLYDMLYKESAWDNKRIYSAAFDLSISNKQDREYKIRQRQEWKPTIEQQDILVLGCEEMEPIAERARNMGTTLWFSDQEVKEERLRDIVACGQFTCCANLLKYVFSIQRLIEDQKILVGPDGKNRLQSLEVSLLSDWANFKIDPYHKFTSLNVPAISAG